MSWFSDLVGTSPIDQNFNYDVANADYDPNKGLLSSISDLTSTAGRLRTMGGSLYDRGQGFLSGSDPLMMQQKQWLTRGLQDIGASQAMNLDRMLSMRGIGSGGIRSVVGGSRDRGQGEQLQKGLLNIGQWGVGAGAQLAGMGLQGVQGAGGLYGQAGSLQGGIDTRQLQANIFNTGQTNQQSRYSNEMAYRQAVENRNQKASFANSLMSGLFGLGGQALGGHMFGKAMGGAAKAATNAGSSVVSGGMSLMQNYAMNRKPMTSGALAGSNYNQVTAAPNPMVTNPAANNPAANNTVATNTSNASNQIDQNAQNYSYNMLGDANLGNNYDFDYNNQDWMTSNNAVTPPQQNQMFGQRGAGYGFDLKAWLDRLVGRKPRGREKE